MSRTGGRSLTVPRPALAPAPAASPLASAPRRAAASNRSRVPAAFPPDIGRIPVHPASGRPTPIQRCGIGSTCGCPPQQKQAGVRRDLRRASAGSGGPGPGHAGARPEGTESVPQAVGAALRSGGAPLEAGTRSQMESAFGYDFSRVRIHTDQRAASAALAVQALAYTAGPDVVFGAGQYAPGTSHGRQLLAHELAHVVQQSANPSIPSTLSSPGDALELEADRAASAAASGLSVGSIDRAAPSAASRLHRTVGRLDCPANTASAPADPRAELADADGQARAMAQQLATDLATDAATVRAGIPDTPSATLQAFIDHFGLPTAAGGAGGGFLNRLTGEVRPSLEVAASEEIQILSRRFALVARFFGDAIRYSCGAGQVDVGGCAEDCAAGRGDAFSCLGVSGIGICPSFWTGFADNTARAAVLIHESFHIIWGPTDPRGVGQIGDETLRGPGRNFDVAGCYEFIVDDIFGTDSHAECPAIP